MQRESREEFESREQRVRHTARWCRISATRTLFSDERKFEEAFSSERLLYVSLGSLPESRASTSRPLLLEPLHGPSLSGDTGRESLRTVKNRSRKTKEKTSATHFPLPLPPPQPFSPVLSSFLSFFSFSPPPFFVVPLSSLGFSSGVARALSLFRPRPGASFSSVASPTFLVSFVFFHRHREVFFITSPVLCFFPSLRWFMFLATRIPLSSV
ncbi:hypothetical protein TGGT1_229760 [Toxoplasma gondii GT1]|uniref:Uncharacterized protein n=1 Tax=Toxoplasma gondii (strain ATCC 50853 / GT1) TaxID=507601 RepID=S7WBI2_TOXGG|nr:hypothetical protein TGGT1_229760 [Toxoplasma gondii GT1]